MKILDIKKMRGPNFWSVENPRLIVARVKADNLDIFSSVNFETFSAQLKKIFSNYPALQPFDISLSKTTDNWILGAYARMALALQQMTPFREGFFKIFPTVDDLTFNVAFSYQEEKAGIYAANASERIINALLANQYYDIGKELNEIQNITESVTLGPSTQSIVDAAVARDIPFRRMDCGSLVLLGCGVHQKRIDSSVSEETSNIAVELAADKEVTKELLEKALIPVPEGVIVSSASELEGITDRIPFPLVVKPVNGNQGRGISTDINSHDDLLKAFYRAKEISGEVIVERFTAGNDYRFLVINYRLVAAAKRTPASVTGNGIFTIRQLIEIVNSDPRRGDGHLNVLTKITVDSITEKILADKNLSLDSVLPEGEVLYLKDTANISTGGTATDVTDIVHPENRFLAERTARIIGLDICGIDIVAPDITSPIRYNGGAVIEVNAGPGLRMHIYPSEGKPRDVGKAIVDMLYPDQKNGRIPVIAITGTNGKTTTTRLTAHIVKTMGYYVGYTTTEGIYIGDHSIDRGDCTGYLSSQVILSDPNVEFAVLECARGGILRHGLGFDKCDVGIVTNVGDDHLGLGDVNSVEDMARVKAVVPRSVRPGGYSILNADDELTYAMAGELRSNVAFFSLDKHNPLIKQHIVKGGLAAVSENGWIIIYDGMQRIEVEKITNIPLTFNGRATFNISNAMAAALATYVSKIPLKDIRLGLATFYPSPEQTPGRLNLFQFEQFEVLVDYAHNTHGYKSLNKFLENIKGRHKVGIIAGVGDRRDDDLVNIGKLAAIMFDEIIIRQDKDLRGREVNEIVGLIGKGIKEIGNKTYASIPEESEAITHAIRNARPNSLIVICTDSIFETINLVKSLQEEALLAH